ncbi:MAG: GNAT family N-acetyltransferase [Deltaproteobacteria bacterium]|nr:GNAT family N-acetyltransferase [Deltaproteobacteria bacterium]
MSEMVIRQVDPAGERARILGVLAASLPAAAPAERFDWLYLGNPDGPALVWLAEQDGVALGTSAAHRRRMRVDGTVVDALLLGDFAVDHAHRALGPALRLLRATLAPLRDGPFAFSYDFCSASMQAVYRRMQVDSRGHSERWMHPVSMARLLAAKTGRPTLGAVVGGLGDLLWRGRQALRRRAAGVAVAPLATDCGPEFDALDARLARRHGVSAVRDAAYLNWRYRRNPVWPHAILCARRGGTLRGHAIVRPTQPRLVALVELQAEDTEVAQALLSAAADWANARGAAALHVEVLAEGPAARLVQALGCVRREAHAGPMVCRPADSPHAGTLDAAEQWWLMGGDRDV